MNDVAQSHLLEGLGAPPRSVSPRTHSLQALSSVSSVQEGLVRPWSHTGASLHLSYGPLDQPLLCPALGYPRFLWNGQGDPRMGVPASHTLLSPLSKKKQHLNSNLRISPCDPTSTELGSWRPGAPGLAPSSTDHFPSALSNHADTLTCPSSSATSPCSRHSGWSEGIPLHLCTMKDRNISIDLVGEGGCCLFLGKFHPAGLPRWRVNGTCVCVCVCE